jgi:hypothetical protein
MNEKERQVLEAQLYSIDRHRAELELVAGTFPPHDFRREAIEREIASLWRRRVAPQPSPSGISSSTVARWKALGPVSSDRLGETANIPM